MTQTAVQCETSNVVALLLILIAHGTYILLKHSRLTTQHVCVAAIISAVIYVVAVRAIVFLTIMHQIMGMMAAEGAAYMTAESAKYMTLVPAGRLQSLLQMEMQTSHMQQQIQLLRMQLRQQGCDPFA